MTALSDELVVVAHDLGYRISGEVRIWGLFGDLALLGPMPTPLFEKDPSGNFRLVGGDPAIGIVGFSRYVALHRVNDEIRFFAGPLVPESDFVSEKDKTPARLDAIIAGLITPASRPPARRRPPAVLPGSRCARASGGRGS
jgi:hypothetical protein